MRKVKSLLIGFIFGTLILTSGCSTESQKEIETQKVFEKTTVKKEKTDVESVDNSLFDELVKTNESKVIKADNFSYAILMEEYHCIRLPMEDISIRCSKEDFTIIQEANKTHSITLVYEPLDYDKYISTYEDEKRLVAYKVNEWKEEGSCSDTATFLSLMGEKSLWMMKHFTYI